MIKYWTKGTFWKWLTCNFYHLFRYDAVGAMRAMEKFTQEVGGYPFLYADIFMTREEFEEMFDLTGICSILFQIVFWPTVRKKKML